MFSSTATVYTTITHGSEAFSNFTCLFTASISSLRPSNYISCPRDRRCAVGIISSRPARHHPFQYIYNTHILRVSLSDRKSVTGLYIAFTFYSFVQASEYCFARSSYFAFPGYVWPPMHNTSASFLLIGDSKTGLRNFFIFSDPVITIAFQYFTWSRPDGSSHPILAIANIQAILSLSGQLFSKHSKQTRRRRPMLHLSISQARSSNPSPSVGHLVRRHKNSGRWQSDKSYSIYLDAGK